MSLQNSSVFLNSNHKNYEKKFLEKSKLNGAVKENLQHRLNQNFSQNSLSRNLKSRIPKRIPEKRANLDNLFIYFGDSKKQKSKYSCSSSKNENIVELLSPKISKQTNQKVEGEQIDKPISENTESLKNYKPKKPVVKITKYRSYTSHFIKKKTLFLNSFNFFRFFDFINPSLPITSGKAPSKSLSISGVESPCPICLAPSEQKHSELVCNHCKNKNKKNHGSKKDRDVTYYNKKPKSHKTWYQKGQYKPKIYDSSTTSISFGSAEFCPSYLNKVLSKEFFETDKKYRKTSKKKHLNFGAHKRRKSEPQLSSTNTAVIESPFFEQVDCIYLPIESKRSKQKTVCGRKIEVTQRSFTSTKNTSISDQKELKNRKNSEEKNFTRSRSVETFGSQAAGEDKLYYHTEKHERRHNFSKPIDSKCRVCSPKRTSSKSSCYRRKKSSQTSICCCTPSKQLTPHKNKRTSSTCSKKRRSPFCYKNKAPSCLSKRKSSTSVCYCKTEPRRKTSSCSKKRKSSCESVSIKKLKKKSHCKRSKEKNICCQEPQKIISSICIDKVVEKPCDPKKKKSCFKKKSKKSICSFETKYPYKDTICTNKKPSCCSRKKVCSAEICGSKKRSSRSKNRSSKDCLACLTKSSSAILETSFLRNIPSCDTFQIEPCFDFCVCPKERKRKTCCMKKSIDSQTRICNNKRKRSSSCRRVKKKSSVCSYSSRKSVCSNRKEYICRKKSSCRKSPCRSSHSRKSPCRTSPCESPCGSAPCESPRGKTPCGSSPCESPRGIAPCESPCGRSPCKKSSSKKCRDQTCPAKEISVQASITSICSGGKFKKFKKSCRKLRRRSCSKEPTQICVPCPKTSSTVFRKTSKSSCRYRRSRSRSRSRSPCCNKQESNLICTDKTRIPCEDNSLDYICRVESIDKVCRPKKTSSTSCRKSKKHHSSSCRKKRSKEFFRNLTCGRYRHKEPRVVCYKEQLPKTIPCPSRRPVCCNPSYIERPECWQDPCSRVVPNCHRLDLHQSIRVEERPCKERKPKPCKGIPCREFYISSKERIPCKERKPCTERRKFGRSKNSVSRTSLLKKRSKVCSKSVECECQLIKSNTEIKKTTSTNTCTPCRKNWKDNNRRLYIGNCSPKVSFKHLKPILDQRPDKHLRKNLPTKKNSIKFCDPPYKPIIEETLADLKCDLIKITEDIGHFQKKIKKPVNWKTRSVKSFLKFCRNNSLKNNKCQRRRIRFSNIAKKSSCISFENWCSNTDFVKTGKMDSKCRKPKEKNPCEEICCNERCVSKIKCCSNETCANKSRKKLILNPLSTTSPDVYKYVFGPTLDETVIAGIYNFKKFLHRMRHCQSSEENITDDDCTDEIRKPALPNCTCQKMCPNETPNRDKDCCIDHQQQLRCPGGKSLEESNISRIVSSTGVNQDTKKKRDVTINEKEQSQKCNNTNPQIYDCNVSFGTNSRTTVGSGNTNVSYPVSETGTEETYTSKGVDLSSFGPSEANVIEPVREQFNKTISELGSSKNKITPYIDVSSTNLTSRNQLTHKNNDTSHKNVIPKETRFAITKILKYDDFTTYEIYKSTRAKPKVLPSKTEGIFVLQNKNMVTSDKKV